MAKTGDARIGFVGFPSVGKSTLLSNLAGVYSEVASYEFTTLTTVPGVIKYKGKTIYKGYIMHQKFVWPFKLGQCSENIDIDMVLLIINFLL